MPEIKVLAPGPPTTVVERPDLKTRLDRAGSARIITVVGGAGFGKSTLLASWAERRRACWYTVGPEDADPVVLARGLFHALRLRIPGLVPDVSLNGSRGADTEHHEATRAAALASFLAATLEDHLDGALVVVIDDLHEIDGAVASVRLVEELCRQAPARLQVALASRTDPPFPIGRLRAQGRVVELSAAELCFSPAEVEIMLGTELGNQARAMAGRLYRLTEGWPAAVRLGAEVLRDLGPAAWSDALARAGTMGDRVTSYLAEEVLARLDPAMACLLRTAVPLARFTAGLAAGLGVSDADATIAAAERRGLVVASHGSEHWYSVHPVVRTYGGRHLDAGIEARRDVRGRAAVWLEAADEIELALTCWEDAGADTEVARLLTERGPDLLAAGGARRLALASERLPARLRNPIIDRLDGEARHLYGDWDGALTCLERLVPASGPVPASTAWRVGLIHQMRGELELAAELYERTDLDGSDGAEGADRDRAMVLAWSAALRWLRGDVEACRSLAAKAMTVATAAGDHQAAAAAHTALAMAAALDGDRRANDAHYLRALDHAEQCGDVLQLIRIRANRSSRLLEEGSYLDAIGEADAALRLAERSGFASFRALALANRGQALFHLGRFEEASQDNEASKAEYQALGSLMVSYPLGQLGDLHRARGASTLARASYEEAIEVAEQAGDLQGLVPALAGLARLVADDDSSQAERLAARAMSSGTTIADQHAVLAAADVALHRSDTERAVELADRAAALCRKRRDRAGLAEALELQAATDPSPAGLDRLDEAGRLWEDLASPLGAARVALALGLRLAGSDPVTAAEHVRRAEVGFEVLGARRLAATATRARAEIERATVPALTVETLGGFQVRRGLDAVVATEWQSRKARDLVKILAARRGQPVSRDALVELLWPEEDLVRSARRLSVALSTARAVFDPHKRHDPELFLAADRDTLRLRLDQVHLDVDQFLADADAAVAASRRDPGANDIGLAAVEQAYSGDFLPDDPYEDWAVSLREEARSAYVLVTRALAEAAAGAGDADGAVRHGLRVLEHDPYDEGAHLLLVGVLIAAGRHGEARRTYANYTARMQDIDIEPSPYPARVT